MPKALTTGLIAGQLALAALVSAADQKLPEIVVSEERIITPTRQCQRTVLTGEEKHYGYSSLATLY